MKPTYKTNHWLLSLPLTLMLFIFSLELQAGSPVGAGFYHSILLRDNGTVWTWGRDNGGQLGNGGSGDSSIPAQVSGLSGVIWVEAGENSGFARKSDGSLWAWGFNGSGQLGDGTTTQRETPVVITTMSNVVSLSAHNDWTIAVKSDGTVWTWGWNLNGVLADNTPTFRANPAQVAGLSNIIAVAAGMDSAFALQSNGTVFAWGGNYYGHLGLGASFFSTNAPQLNTNISDVIALETGSHHCLALKSNGTVWGWGYNGSGNLGNGTTTDMNLPTAVYGFYGAPWDVPVVAISAGGTTSLALKSDGTVWGFGANGYGQLGNGTTTDSSIPIRMGDLSGIQAIAAGFGHCLLVKSCDVLTVGDSSYGQLGNGNLLGSMTPVTLEFKRCTGLSLSGPVSIFNPNDPGEPVIFMDPGLNGGTPFFGILGEIFANSMEVAGPVSISGPLTLTTPLSPASGGSGMNNGSLAADRFLFTTAVGTFGSAPVTSFARSLMDDTTAAGARATLGVPSQGEILPLPFWKFNVVTQFQDFLGGTADNSAGSGIAFWPNQNSFLLMDNSPAQIREMTRTNTVLRTITLQGFGDTEDIQLLAGNTFIICTETNGASKDEFVIIDLPTGTGNANVNIAAATRRLQINLATLKSQANAGIEGFVIIGTNIFFITEKAPFIPNTTIVSNGLWHVWRVAIPPGGAVTQTVTPVPVFRLAGLLNGKATDLSSMATDGSILWLLSHEGANISAPAPGRLLRVTLDGRLIEDSTLPSFSEGETFWRQAEGVNLFTDGDGLMKILLTGEVGSGGTGVQFMLLSP